MRYLPLLFIFIATACSSPRYFIVRHAEKAILQRDSAGMMSNNPPLSEAGKVRSYVLRDELAHKNIRHIYSTNTLRTRSTAGPLSEEKHIEVEIYSNIDSLIYLLKSLRGNVLVIGHSNTVDDIVNKICGKTEIPADLKDAEYDNLFIVRKKNGHFQFTRKKYGYPSNPE